ncbi:SDR family NAD(P)-dependent oxidoreductase [Paragemmobacter straminiformis]|uniref:SDR family NAD(P)-dependent oxidoreductase n=1 Tax=Paragemmobacter straminiformis TaxID=2045119 RepID=A0A842IDC6_9RHOB|nr:SDR family NAD(P)-dependent oxidoreductase [Gemmobacter straminiformis]MBC2837287.1 SDR family NAD(P)-dependent oxidoreductase [Gemmobacter straminiformis]
MTRPLHPTALVTGGNRGIGLAICKGLVAKGCRVTLAARDEAAGRKAAAEAGCAFVRLDLADPDTSFDAVVQAGGFDILVNNAGVMRDVSLLSPRSDFAEAMEVMVQAPLDLIRLNLPHWRDGGWGRIVNLSSGWGAHAEGLGGPGAYGVAKAALNALTRALPRDLPAGVKVNACCPGWVATRMGGADAPLSPEEGADTPVWLALLPEDGPTGGFFRRRQPVGW